MFVRSRVRVCVCAKEREKREKGAEGRMDNKERCKMVYIISQILYDKHGGAQASVRILGFHARFHVNILSF